ncbi:MAG: hypothetical protein J7L15_01090 [Clostridiales bacterium]|nr:hypothetical protein [Clostridiales bacterium]
MAGTGTIKVEDIHEMTDIVEDLTKRGLGFEVRKEGCVWIIELTGAY